VVRINIARVVGTAHKLEKLRPDVGVVIGKHFLPLDEVLPEDTDARVAVPRLLKRPGWRMTGPGSESSALA